MKDIKKAKSEKKIPDWSQAICSDRQPGLGIASRLQWHLWQQNRQGQS